MDLYLRKKRWKLILFATAVLIVAASLYYTNILVNEIRKDERKNVEIWAEAIHQKADLVNFTNNLFEQIKNEERKKGFHRSGGATPHYQSYIKRRPQFFSQHHRREQHHSSDHHR